MNTEDMRQLTIRLNADTLQDLERVVEVMQKDGPVGVVYTRTDALRNVIMRGISSYTRNLPPIEPPPPAPPPVVVAPKVVAIPVKKRSKR